ncbi:neurofilament medium polypeptide-like [Penaeus japonicus]|uniref:neurofilament medium polypeptide-like n=1 Tax=Penaeus japonicus TaxID=27405 RepID=UPI001C71727D|nr:neurofilament medium polypeptide-like [Penaeus japonicus]
MEDLLSCMVCCEPYQEKMRHPVLLPRCGHSFCRPCIAFMVKGGNVVCPSCRMDQRVETADDLPTEFSLLAITAAQQVAKLETCQLHDVKLSFWCRTCKTATCGECLFEDHPTHSHDVIKSTRYIIEMKDAINDLANKFMETLDIRERRLYDLVYKSAKGINDALRTICVLRKDMEEARDLMKGVKKVDGIAPTTRLSEAAKFLGLKWNLHDAKLGLGPAGRKKEQQKQNEKSEAEVRAEAEEKKQESTEEKEGDKGKEDNEKKGDDKTQETKDSEKNNKEEEEEEEEDDESTDESEEEVLTEEEIKKRNKILKVKERIAAAAAAAAAEKEIKEKKQMEKERKSVKEKNNASTEPEQVPSPKILKSWKKRNIVNPVSREPSITPEREVEKKEKIESPTEKEDSNKESDKDKENTENEDKSKKEETDAKAEDKEQNKDKDNNETNEAESESAKKKDKSPETTANDPPKASNEPSSTPNNPPKDKEKADEAKKEAETKKEKEAKKAPSSAATKRPRGRLARQALKRAQTMDLSKRVQPDGDKEEGEAESQNIKGLDLETGKANKAEEPENKESDAGAAGETKEEGKDDKKDKEEKKEEEKKTEETKKEDEARGGATAVKEDEEEAMFELDPDEKDRIATELMMVPSLTVCVEGRGGLMARVQWEPQGLHVYSHQAQDLPYDVLIKSSVLNALIPTKSPTIFLDIEYEQRMLGRVYITLFGHLRRANNFLLLCTGETGSSLKSSKFFEVCNPEAPGERLKGGDYEFNNGRGGEALIEDLEFGGDYAQPMEAGMITAGGSGHRCFDSQFLICTEGDPNRSFACPFGVVTSGLSYLKEAVWLVVTKEIWIEECGVLLDVPRF